MLTRRLKNSFDALLFLALGFIALILALPASGQTKIETADGSTVTPTELHCTRSDSGDWECSACLRYSVSVDTGAGTRVRNDATCSRPRALRAANANRVQTVADALVPTVLRQAGFEAVDAGAP